MARRWCAHTGRRVQRKTDCAKRLELSESCAQAVDEMKVHQRSAIANHPNIVTLRYFFQDENYLYYIYEFANSGNLRDLMRQIPKKRHGALVSNDLLQLWMSELLSVLWTLAREKVVHRAIDVSRKQAQDSISQVLCPANQDSAA